MTRRSPQDEIVRSTLLLLLILLFLMLAAATQAQSLPTIALHTYASRFGDESHLGLTLPRRRPLDIALDMALLRGRFRPGGSISLSPQSPLPLPLIPFDLSTVTLGDSRLAPQPIAFPIAFPDEFLTGAQFHLQPRRPNRFGHPRISIALGRFAALRGFWGRFLALRETGARFSAITETPTLSLASSALIARRTKALTTTLRSSLSPSLTLFTDTLISRADGRTSAAFTPGLALSRRHARASASYTLASGSPSRLSQAFLSHEPRGPSASASLAFTRFSATATFARSVSGENGNARQMDIAAAAAAVRLTGHIALRASLTHIRTDRFGNPKRDDIAQTTPAGTIERHDRPDRFGARLSQATLTATLDLPRITLETGLRLHTYQHTFTAAAETKLGPIRIRQDVQLALATRSPQAEGHRFTTSASIITRSISASLTLDIRSPKRPQTLSPDTTALALTLTIPLPQDLALTAAFRRIAFTSPPTATSIAVPEARLSLSIPILRPKRNARTDAILEGRVIAEDNSPVADVLILLDDGQNVYTDAEGRFRFYTTPGRHTVTLDADSLPERALLLSPKSQTAIARTESPTPITFRLRIPPKPTRQFIFQGS